MTEERTATWDGKNLAAVQTATHFIPRRGGRPAAEVDKDWNLTINDIPTPVGSVIAVSPDGSKFSVTVYGD